MPQRQHSHRPGPTWRQENPSWHLVALLLLCAGAAQCGVAASTMPTISSATATNTYSWTLTAALTNGATFTAKRGDPITLGYTATATPKLVSSTGALAGSVSITWPDLLSKVEFATSGGALLYTQTSVPATNCSNGCNVPFSFDVGPPAVPGAQRPSPGVTGLKVTPYFAGGAAGDAGDVAISWVSKDVGLTATIKEDITFPTWSQYYVGQWLAMAPTTAVASGTSPTETGTTISADPDNPAPSIYTWTWLISNNVLCFTGVSISNTITLTPTGGVAAPAPVPLTATVGIDGCNVRVGIDVSDMRTQTTLSWSWSHSIQPTGPTTVTVPYGGGGQVSARAVFQRTVSSATFLLTGQIQITNPEPGPIALNRLELQCLWGATVVLPCGGFTGQGTTMILPASATVNCAIANLLIPGTWGTDFTQPCRIVTQSWWGTTTQQEGIILNFAAPLTWIRINDCVQWSVTCTQPTGTAAWRPTVTGGPSSGGLQICGNDLTSNLPDQALNFGIGGGWAPSYMGPGTCPATVQASCSSQIILQNTGNTAIGSSGGGQMANLQLGASIDPTTCPQPPPSPSPSPSPTPDSGPGFLGVSRMEPKVSVAVTKTYIKGAFGWTVSASVDPAGQPVSMGSSGRATYRVRATRGNANDAAAVQRIMEGVIKLENPFPKDLPLASVSALLGNGRVAACQPSELALPGTLPAGATRTCTFAVQYNGGDTPGMMDAEVIFPDSATPVTAAQQAPFSFADADASGATGACALVSATFAANQGMGLIKLGDIGAPPLKVDGSPVRICGTTDFGFDVQYSPGAPLACGSQPVVMSVNVTAADGDSQAPVRTAEATATITVTNCQDLSDAGAAPGAPDSQQPSQAAPPPPGGPQLSVALSGITKAQVSNPVWTLSLSPVGADDGAVRKMRSEEGRATFKMAWSRSLERVTQYSGNVKVTNTGDVQLLVDSITVELVDTMSPDNSTVAQITVTCPGEVSSASPLTLAPQADATCAFVLKSPLGGSLVATATADQLGDAVQSEPQAVTTFMAAAQDEPQCARLVSGLAATALVPEGKLLAPGGMEASDVCQAGSKEFEIAIPATPDAPCARWPLMAVARLEPPASTSAVPVTAASSVDVAFSDCPADAAPPRADVSALRAFRTRVMRWSVKKWTTPTLEDNTLQYKPGGDNTLNVTVLYSRSREDGGPRVTVAGAVQMDAAADGGGAPAIGDASKVLLIPLCPRGDDCGATTESALSCNDTVVDGRVTCRFRADRVPLVSGVAVPLVLSGPNQAPAPARPRAYNPTAFSGRRTLGRCAVLTDDLSITAPAAVQRLNEVRPPPLEQVCLPSWSYTYQIRFDKVKCDTLFDFGSTARATPVDANVPPASASLNFGVEC